MKEGVAALSRGGRRPISRSAFKILSAHVVGEEEGRWKKGVAACSRGGRLCYMKGRAAPLERRSPIFYVQPLSFNQEAGYERRRRRRFAWRTTPNLSVSLQSFICSCCRQRQRMGASRPMREAGAPFFSSFPNINQCSKFYRLMLSPTEKERSEPPHREAGTPFFCLRPNHAE